MLNGCGSGVGVGTGTSGRCGVDFTKPTGGDVAGSGLSSGSGVALDSGDTTILIAVDSGVGVGVELTKAAGGDITGTAVTLGSGDTTVLTAVGSRVGVGVEVLTPGVETGLKDGVADVIKVLVTAEDFGSSTLVPALFLTQSSISGSKRSRSFARACSRSTAIWVLTRPLSLDRFLLKPRISSAVSRSYMPSTIAGTRAFHNVCDRFFSNRSNRPLTKFQARSACSPSEASLANALADSAGDNSPLMASSSVVSASF